MQAFKLSFTFTTLVGTSNSQYVIKSHLAWLFVLDLFLTFLCLTCQDNILLVDKNTNKRSAVIFLRQGQNAVVRLSVGSAICIETFNDFPQMGRFVLRKESK